MKLSNSLDEPRRGGQQPGMVDRDEPFVLLSGASAQAPSRLYRGAATIVRADTIAQVEPALDRIAQATAAGWHTAGFLSYEAGFAFEPRLHPLARPQERAAPLIWFGLFEQVASLTPDEVAALIPAAAGATAAGPEPTVSRADYEGWVEEAQTLIAAGEIYQANLSFQARVRFAGHPLALYAGLRERARAGWGGVLFTGEHWLLSLSPELFFTLSDGQMTARPMKGTAVRGANGETDAAAKATLAADPKNRAENLMIVDLVRNDLSRVSVAGSVKVPHLFAIETYPTVHHLTSTVEARLTDGLGAIDVLRAAFPCGSITGAPKIRSQQAIAALEPSGRGAYTGSIGWIAPGGEAAFNVAIRTLTVAAGAQEGTLGLGAGIVADSVASDEWRECLAKGAFVTAGARRFDLVETMRFVPDEGIADLDRHLERLARSAETLGFAFNRHDARNALQSATFRQSEAAAVRLHLSRGGALSIEARPLPSAPTGPVVVALARRPVDRDDFRLRPKTGDRGFWDDAKAAGGEFETLVIDDEGFLAEGTFTSLFVGDADALRTPPLARGLLPGVLRARLIDEGRAREADLRPEDLANGFWIGNALRGLITARLARP